MDYNMEVKREHCMVLENFWFPFVVALTTTDHVSAGFGCMQLNSLCGG